MFRKKIIYILFLSIGLYSYGQVKNNGGKVGIGTTDPQRTLHVEGSVRIRDLADKTDDKKYDNVLLLKTKAVTQTITATGKVVTLADKGDIYHVPRKLFRNYTSIDPLAISRMVVYKDLGERLSSDSNSPNRKALWNATYDRFENADFIIEKEDNPNGKWGEFQFQYYPTIFNANRKAFRGKIEWHYAIENRAAVWHRGTSVAGQYEKTGSYFYVSEDVSSLGEWTDLLPRAAVLGSSFDGHDNPPNYNPRVIDNGSYEYILFDFGTPFVIDNPYQAIYRIRAHTIANKPLENLNQHFDELDIPMSNDNGFILYTIQELANTSEIEINDAELAKKNSLWLTGAYTGRNAQVSRCSDQNRQYPIGIEIYIPDLVNLTWDDARFFSIRFGWGTMRPLFYSSTQFDELKTKAMNSTKAKNFMYLYYSDKPGEWNACFPTSEYGELASSRSQIYNMKLGGDENAVDQKIGRVMSGRISIIIYYKGALVDSIGDGVFVVATDPKGYDGFTLNGGTVHYPNLNQIDYTFDGGGWLKRKPGTSPLKTGTGGISNGFFIADDWYRPKDQTTHKPWNCKFGATSANHKIDFPFPVGNLSSQGKGFTHWSGESYSGYTYP